ncbi:ATP synthase mitochondrial F1 complex assembly factor 2-like isoform X2 [Oscarella lobularis]|uniref:ATP synthase mitochondrial F1 complex assembly factor 2-like isoform X2 n=1 Tax=Oscarella lobularis TaxID=121494 RepID=UPI0033141A24
MRRLSFSPSSAALKRFYKRAGVAARSDGLYAVQLDGRTVKTPLRRRLVFESEPLAVAVAAEWDAQTDKVRPPLMHLTGLCMTDIDQPDALTKTSLIGEILPHLQTDCTCSRLVEPDDLVRLQEVTWDPLIGWFQNRYGVLLRTTTSLLQASQSNETLDSLRRELFLFTKRQLLGLRFGVFALESLVIMMAVIENRLSVEKAVDAARIETEFQIQHWGNVEWSHSLNKLDTTARLAAAIMYLKHTEKQ